MISELRIAINNKLKSIFTRVYYNAGPISPTMPYCVFSHPTGSSDYDSATRYPVESIQVAIYGETLTELETLEASVDSNFAQAQSQWSLTNYNVTEIRQEFRSDPQKVGTVYVIIHQYSFYLETK